MRSFFIVNKKIISINKNMVKIEFILPLVLMAASVFSSGGLVFIQNYLEDDEEKPKKNKRKNRI